MLSNINTPISVLYFIFLCVSVESLNQPTDRQSKKNMKHSQISKNKKKKRNKQLGFIIYGSN